MGFVKRGVLIAPLVILGIGLLQAQTELEVRYLDDIEVPDGSAIYGFAQDQHGFLWMGGWFGLGKARRGNEVVISKAAQGSISDLKLIGTSVFALNPRDGFGYLIEGDGRERKVPFGFNNTSRHLVLHPDSSKHVAFLYSSGRLWSISDKGVTTEVYDSIRFCWALEQFDQSRLGLATKGGLLSFDPATLELKPLLEGWVSVDSVRGFAHGRGKSFVVCSRSVHEVKNDQIVNSWWVPLHKTDELVDAKVDRKGRVWVSGERRGLYYIQGDSLTDAVEELRLAPTTRITSMFLPKGPNIWFGIHGGKTMIIEDSKFQIVNELDGLHNEVVVHMAFGRSNDLWIGTGGGVFYLKDKRLRWLDVLGSKMELKSVADYDFKSPQPMIGYLDYSRETGSGLLATMFSHGKEAATDFLFGKVMGEDLLMTNGSVSSWKGKNQIEVYDYGNMFDVTLDFTKETVVESKKKPINRREFAPDGAGRVWHANSSGVLEGYQLKDEFYPLSSDSFNQSVVKILTYPLKMIKLSAKGEPLFLTSKGIAFCEEGMWTSVEFSSIADSLTVDDLAKDSSDRIWMSGHKGLFSYNKTTGKIRQHFLSKFSTKYITNLLFDPVSNRLFMGGRNGLAIANTDEIYAHKPPTTTVVIDEIESINDTSYLYPEELDLTSNQNNLKLKYDSPHFGEVDELEYEYSQISAVGPWSATQKKQLELLSMSYGEHNIYVRARIDEGPWSTPAHVKFTIATPFWQRHDVQLSIAAILVFLVIFFAVIRLKVVRKRDLKEREMLLQVKDLEQQALGAMMNPHFVYNSLASIQGYFTRTNNLAASEHVAELGQLIRMNMNAASESFVGLAEELERLKLYLKLEKVRMAAPFSYHIALDPAIQVAITEIPSMVIQPFLENAIIHGIRPLENQKGHIDISLVQTSKGVITVNIKDNGIGLSMARQNSSSHHKSKGIQITEDRLKLLLNNQEQVIELKDRLDVQGNICGTEVTLTIPIKTKEFS